MAKRDRKQLEKNKKKRKRGRKLDPGDDGSPPREPAAPTNSAWIRLWKRATVASAAALGLVMAMVLLDIWRSATAVGLTLGLTLVLLLIAAGRGLFYGVRRMAREPRHLLAASASAACIVLSFPPFDIAVLVFVAWVPLLWVCLRVTAWQSFFWGWYVGAALTALGFYFIPDVLQVYGGLPFGAAVIGHVLFSAFQGVGIGIFAGLARWLAGTRHRALLFVAPVTYVVAELAVREVYIFPWYLGSCTYSLLWFVQMADIFGGFGLTALVVFINAVILHAWMSVRAGEPFPVRPATLAAGLVAAALIYGVVRIGQVEAVMAEQPSIKVGIVEADIGIETKSVREYMEANRLLHQRLSVDLASRGAELILWPETSVPFGHFALTQEKTMDLNTLKEAVQLRHGVLHRATTYFRPSKVPPARSVPLDQETPPLERYALQRGFDTPLLFGSLTGREPTAAELPTVPPDFEDVRMYRYNTMFLLDEHGRVLGTYDKKVLLQFGEHFPLAHELYQTLGVNPYEWLPTVVDVSAGETVEVLELPLPRDGGVTKARLGAMICYEDILSRHALQLSELRPNIFVNIINDAWFGQSSAAYHHMAFSVLRTIEHRLPLVRATNTGVSSIIDPVGRIVVETELTGIETLLEDVPIMDAQSTIYSQVGDLVAWISLLLLGWLVYRRRTAVTADS